MSNQAQIQADAELARRLQEAEFDSATRYSSFSFRRHSPSSSASAAPPYFFQTSMGPGGPSSHPEPPRPPTTGIPDRERTPYAFVRDEDTPHPAGHGHPSPESMARAAARANAARASAHAHATPDNIMLETFSALFSGSPPAPPRRARFGPGGRSSAAPRPPPILPDSFADILRHVHPQMAPPPSFFNGPRGESTSFFMGGSGGGEIPHFFRAMMGGAGAPATYEEFLDLIERRGNVNRGAADEEIDKLKVETFKPAPKTSSASAAGQAAGVDDAEKCVVCLGEYEEGDELLVLPCEHRFHKDCVSKWLKVNRTCPSCKRSIRPGDATE